MKRLNIPKTQIYAKTKCETYEIDILDDYNLIMYDVFEENILKNQTIDIYIFDVASQKYNWLFAYKFGLEINSNDSALIIDTNEIIKSILRDLVLKVNLPELNILDDVQQFNQISKNHQLKKNKSTTDRIFQQKINDQICHYKKQIYNIVKEKETLFEGVECALTLDSIGKIKKFINGGIYSVIEENDSFSQYWYDNFVSRIYIGSQFCPLKCREIDDIRRTIEKCYELGKNVTINTSFLTEGSIQDAKGIIELISNLNLDKEFISNIEITINDYAYLKLLENRKDIKRNLGILLNRRQKDPRFAYRWGADHNYATYMENAIAANNIELFTDYYHQFENIEYENNHIGNCFSTYNNTLHFPLYQTNTSSYCPMNAYITNHDSNRQYSVKNCVQYCDDFYYQYGDEMSLIGIGNSNFGICTKLDNLEKNIKKGKIQRFVWNFI